MGTEMKRLKILCYQFIFNGFHLLGFFCKIGTLEQWECAFSCLLLILRGKLWYRSSVSQQLCLGSSAQNSVQNTGDKNSACRNHHNKHTQVKAAVSCSEYMCGTFQFCSCGISKFQFTRLAGVLLGSPEGKRFIPDMNHQLLSLRQDLCIPDLCAFIQHLNKWCKWS